MACHKKCEKLTGNLCGLNQKLVAEALQSLKRGEFFFFIVSRIERKENIVIELQSKRMGS